MKIHLPIVVIPAKVGIQSFFSGFWIKSRITKAVRFTILGSLLLILGVSALTIYLQTNHSAEAAWFNSNWSYRKAINITAHTTAETNVYMTLSSGNALDTSDTSKFQPDCGDLRFTDVNGKLLPYYIVSGCGTSSTVIHVLLQNFPAGAQTIYYYYGNPQASNGFSQTDFTTAASGVTIGSFSTEQVGPGPIGYWKFDEGYGTMAKDETSNGNNVTLSGSILPTWQTEDQCISGKCLYFDGSSSYVSLTNNTTQDPSSVSTSLWFKDTNVDGNFRVLLAKGRDAGSSAFAYGLRVENNNKLNFWYYNTGGETSLTYSTALTQGQWYHVEATYDATTHTAILYVNGNQSATKTSGSGSLDYGTVQPLSIGDWQSGASNTDFFNGFIDEVKIYPYARTAAQVKVDYISRGSRNGAGSVLGIGANNQFAALNNGLVGYWKMDEATWSGTLNEVVDSSGNGDNGQAQGPSNSKAYPGTPSKFGNAGQFDGIDNYIQIPNTHLPPTDTFTLSAWVKRSATGSFNTIIGTGTNAYQLAFVNNHIKLSKQSVGDIFVSTNTYTDTTNWHSIIAIKNGSTAATVYYDGTPVAGTFRNFTIQVGASSVYIGGDGNLSDVFAGSIDDVRIYNRALSPADVQILYNFAPGPFAYYNFEEGTGSTVNDTSGSGFAGSWNGTLGNQWTYGKIGKAGKFNGTDNYIQANYNLVNPGPAFGPITVEAWIKPNSVAAGTQEIITNSSDASHQNYTLEINRTAGKVSVVWGDAVILTGNTTLSVGKWYHIAFVRSGSVGNWTASIYINGALDKSTTTSTDPNMTFAVGKTAIGSLYDGASGLLFFSGAIDQVATFIYPRTSQQISQDMNPGLSTTTDAGGHSGAVGYWKFDEGYGTVADNSGSDGNNSPGTLTNMTQSSTSGWTPSGAVGKALNFDGGNDFVDIANNPAALQITGNLTLSAWINLGSHSAVDMNLIAKDGASGNWGYRLYVTSANKISMEVSKDGTTVTGGTNGATVTGNTVLSNSKWYFVTGVYNPSTSLTVYINGKQDGQNTSVPSSIFNSTNDLDIGAQEFGNVVYSGSIDEPKVYNYSLSPQDILLDFNRGSAIVAGALSNNASYQPNSGNQEYCVPGDATSCTSPSGRFDFEEGSGSTVADTSGVANDSGTWHGNGLQHWKLGKIGMAGNFDGTDDYVDMGAGTLDDTGALTIEAWIKLNSDYTDTQTIMGDTTSGGGASTYLFEYGRTDNHLTFVDSGSVDATSTNTISDNNWHHVVVTRSGSSGSWTIKFYIDGALDSSTGTANDPGTNGNVSIGRAGSFNGNYFKGEIDHVELFTYARTASQVAWDYNKGGPVGWWKMDECQGAVIHDSSGLGNNGTLNLGASGVTSPGTCSDGTGTTAWSLGSIGKFNSSMSFDGTDDTVSIPEAPDLRVESAPFSISSWINLASEPTSGNQYTLFSKGAGGSGGYALMYYNSGGTYYLNLSKFGTVDQLLPLSAQIATSTWTHIVAVQSAASVQYFINGKSVGSFANGSAYNSSSSYSPYIGSLNNSSSFLAGQIDDMRVYNYALTALQIKTVYNNGAAVRFAPLVGSP